MVKLRSYDRLIVDEYLLLDRVVLLLEARASKPWSILLVFLALDLEAAAANGDMGIKIESIIQSRHRTETEEQVLPLG